MAHGDNPEVHQISGHTFTCTAPEDAPCRTLPTCDCEQWCGCKPAAPDAEQHDEGEHCCMGTVRSGQACWLRGWIDAAGLGDSYGGLDGFGDPDDHFPDGPVTCEWDGDYVLWTYADDTRPRVPDGDQ